MPHPLTPYLVLAVALLAVSHAAIFARLADAAPLAIAAWRLGIACLVVLRLAITATHAGRISLRPMGLLGRPLGQLNPNQGGSMAPETSP